MNSYKVILLALLSLAACKKKDNDDGNTYPYQSTKVADHHLYRIDVDGKNYQRKVMYAEFVADDQNELTVAYWQTSGDFYCDSFVKDKMGRISSLAWQQRFWGVRGTFLFTYDNESRIKSRIKITEDFNGNTYDTVKYYYDDKDRIVRTQVEYVQYLYFYTGNRFAPDSVQTFYTSSEVASTDYFSFDDRPSPFSTLPAIVDYISQGALFISRLSGNLVQHRSVGFLGSSETFTYTYNANGKPAERVSDKGYTFYYHYK